MWGKKGRRKKRDSNPCSAMDNMHSFLVLSSMWVRLACAALGRISTYIARYLKQPECYFDSVTECCHHRSIPWFALRKSVHDFLLLHNMNNVYNTTLVIFCGFLKCSSDMH